MSNTGIPGFGNCPWFIHAKTIGVFKTEVSAVRGLWTGELATPAWNYLLERGAFKHYASTTGGPGIYYRQVQMSVIRALIREHFEQERQKQAQLELPVVT